MARGLFDKLKDQLNPFDGGKTFSNPQPARTPQPEQRSFGQKVGRAVSGAVAQVNPLDNGRTYRTVQDKGNSFTPKAPSGVFKQATHNGLTNVVGGVAKPLIRGGIAVNQGLANAQLKAAGRPTLNAEEFTRKSYPASFNRMVGYTGTKRQIAGDTVSNVVNVAAPGSSKLLEAGVKSIAPKVVPKIVPKIISNAAVGAPVGAVGNVGSLVSDDNAPLTRQNIVSAAKSGAIVGAVGGAALPVAGATVRAAAPVVKKGAQATAEAAKDAKYVYDKIDPRVAELDRQYEQLNTRWQTASPQTRKQLEKAILQNRQARKDATNINIGNSTVKRSAPSANMPDSNNPGLNAPGQSQVPESAVIASSGMRGTVSFIPAGDPRNGLVPSASVPRSSGQQTIPERLSPQKTQSEIQLPQKSQKASLVNSTPSATTVKLNTDRLNPDGGYDALARMNQDTTETVTRMSNKQVQEVAKSAGLDTKTHTDDQIRQKIAEQLNVRQDAVRFMNDADVARKSGNVELSEQLLAQAAERGRTSRAQGTDLARQLQARRIVANELDTPQQRIFKLLDNAGVNPEAYVKRLANVDFNDPKAVVDAYRDLVPARFGSWLDTVRYNSMLSSPLTQAVNVFGNAQNVAIVAPIEKTLRGAIDAVGGLFGKERQYAAGEGAAYAGGVATNIRNAANNFVDALRNTGQYANKDLEEYSIPLATKGFAGGAYKTLSAPMRVLDGMDKFFRTLAEAGEDAALNVREKKGIKLNGNRDAIKTAEADYRVFQTELGAPGQGIVNDAFDEFAKLITGGRGSKNPIMSNISKFTIPFVKTVNNIMKQGIVDYSPLGFVNLKGNADKTTALTRAIMGSAVFGTSAALISTGQMTWGEPRNADERARFRAEGKQPYAIKIGGKWVNFSKLTPSVAFPMAMTAALHDALENKDIDQPTSDAILEAVAKVGTFFSDQSYAKGIGNTLAALGGDTEAIASVGSNITQQVIPFRAFTGWLARISDDVERKVDTTQGYFDQQVQLLMQQYPGLRQNTATRDYRGEAIPANNPVLNGLSPVRITDDRGTNPIDAELDAAKDIANDDPLLSKSQKMEVDKRAGPLVAKAQQDLIQTQEFKSLAPEDRKKALDGVKTDIAKIESRKYQAENNVGMYAQDYTGKPEKLTARQAALEKGTISSASYARPSGENASGLPKNYDKLDDGVKKFYDKKLGVSDTEEWESKEVDEDGKDLLRRANQFRPADFPELPKTNKVANLYADYKSRQEKEKWPATRANTEKLKMLREAYKSELGKSDQYWLSASDMDVADAIDNKEISKDLMDKLVGYDNLQTKLKGSAKIGNKLRRALGYSDAPKASSSGGGSGKTASKLRASKGKKPKGITVAKLGSRNNSFLQALKATKFS